MKNRFRNCTVSTTNVILAELLLIRLAYDRQIPMLGICRGIQMLTVALGGSVYQDIYSQQPDRQLLGHDQQLDRRYASHTIQPTADSLVLRRLLGEAPVAVNSFHHQAVKETGPLLRVCATSSDGLIEAVESAEYKSVLGRTMASRMFHPAARREHDAFVPVAM
mgnify:CR=1 FL=1